MKKQSLIDFIQENITDEIHLYCNVEYIVTKQTGGRLFFMTKERLFLQITTMFNDELVGHSGDKIYIRIIDWQIKEKDLSE
jgi:phage terminase large subunit-like protein